MSGKMNRRAFIRRLMLTGVTAAGAVTYAALLDPSSAGASTAKAAGAAGKRRTSIFFYETQQQHPKLGAHSHRDIGDDNYYYFVG